MKASDIEKLKKGETIIRQIEYMSEIINILEKCQKVDVDNGRLRFLSYLPGWPMCQVKFDADDVFDIGSIYNIMISLVHKKRVKAKEELDKL
jgi:hypothetical protein